MIRCLLSFSWGFFFFFRTCETSISCLFSLQLLCLTQISLVDVSCKIKALFDVAENIEIFAVIQCWNSKSNLNSHLSWVCFLTSLTFLLSCTAAAATASIDVLPSSSKLLFHHLALIVWKAGSHFRDGNRQPVTEISQAADITYCPFKTEHFKRVIYWTHHFIDINHAS